MSEKDRKHAEELAEKDRQRDMQIETAILQSKEDKDGKWSRRESGSES